MHWYSGSCGGTYIGEGNQTVSPGSNTNYYARGYNTVAQCYSTNCAQVTVTVVADPSVSISGGTTICSGGSATLTASASGGTGTCSYQWQISSTGTGGWSDVGSDSSTYNTGALTATRYYRCQRSCTGSGCDPATSNVETVTVNANPTPTIMATPGETVCEGTTVTLDAGSYASYLWSPGSATTQTIQVTTSGTYSVTVTDANGCEGSDDIEITVNTNPTANAGGNQSTCPDIGKQLNGSGSGGAEPYSYAWSGDGAGSLDQTNIANPTFTNSTPGSYPLTLTVTDNNGCISAGDSITVTVNETTSITEQPASQTVCPGDTATFSVTAGGSNLTYQWQEYNTGTSEWDDLDGETSAALQITNAGSGDAGDYRCVVDGACGSAQTSNAATLTIAADTSISEQPANAARCPGETAVFSVTASGTNVTYQWQADTGGGFEDISGATGSSYTTGTLTAGDDGNQYRCVVDGDCGSAQTSDAATLTMNDETSITAHPAPATRCVGDTATFTVAATGEGTLTYQWQSDTGSGFEDISGATGSSYTTDALTAGDDGNQYRCVVTGTCGSSTSDAGTLTVAADTSITADPQDEAACPGDQATFNVTATGADLTYQWQADTGSGFTDLNHATGTSYTTPTLSSGYDGNKYRCVVTGLCGAAQTSASATLTMKEEPAITDHPSSQVACPGANVQFGVAASGTGLSYQWTKDGQDISGATSATLSLTDVSGDDYGAYYCVVTGDCGQVLSNAATLTVNTAPAIDQPGPLSQTVAQDSTCSDPANNVVLSATDPDPGEVLSWSVSQQPAYGSVSFPAGQTGSSVTVCYTPAASQTEGVSFTIQVQEQQQAAPLNCGQTETITINVTVASESPLTITGWWSVKEHGNGVGVRKIALDSSKTNSDTGPNGPAVDPRRYGIEKIRVEFSEAVEAVDESLGVNDVTVTDWNSDPHTPDSVTLDGSSDPSATGTVLEIVFNSGLPDQERYTFELAGKFKKAGVSGALSGDTDCQVRSLVGDVNGSGKVTLVDMAYVRSKVGETVDDGNARFDVNVDGRLNLIDMGLTKSRNGNHTPGDD